MEERSDGGHTAPETGVGPIDKAEPNERPATDLNGVASYEDGDAFVVCDRKNAQAWIRSNTVTDLDS